jgi:ribosomal protein S18 acetylase RimI-like enzyme
LSNSCNIRVANFLSQRRFAAFASNGAGASYAAFSLASLVASDAGHITQICVAPSQRSKGIGYALLRRSMLALRRKDAAPWA